MGGDLGGTGGRYIWRSSVFESTNTVEQKKTGHFLGEIDVFVKKRATYMGYIIINVL